MSETNNSRKRSRPDDDVDNYSWQFPKFKYSITPEEVPLYNETLEDMRRDNLARIDSVTPFDYHFFKKRYVDYIFTMAARLRIEPIIRYHAMFLFDRFSSRHIEDCFGVVCESEEGTSDTLNSEKWKHIEAKVSRELTLRIMTCFQISLKTFSSKDFLSSEYTARCLQTFGHSYTKDAILKSELKVALTVQFKFWDRQNPLTYVETLLSVLCNNFHFLEKNMNLFYQKCIFMLDYVLLNTQDIFNFLLMNNYNYTIDNIGQLRFNRLLSDWLLMASSVIYCASLSMKYTEHQISGMIDILSKNTLVPITDIEKFSNAILKKIKYDVNE